MPGDSVEVAFSTVCGRAVAVRARAGVRPVLPVDREFLATGVTGQPESHGTRWLMPCPNSPRVAAALREHSAGRRGAASTMRISGGRGREALHAMIVRRRKRRNGGGPEGAHVTFASNMPSDDPDGPYPRRWGIENNHKLPRQTRMRMSSRDENVRVFCFAVSPMAHSAWTMPHPGRRAAGDGWRIPATAPKFLVLLEVCSEFGVTPRLRPPRKPPP